MEWAIVTDVESCVYMCISAGAEAGKLIFGLSIKFVHLFTCKVCSTRKKIQHLLKEMKYLFI